VTETELDRQVLAIFDKIRIEDENVCVWFRSVLRSQTNDEQADSLAQRAEIQRQMTRAVNQ
jgi:site-specific DNA recombinase